MPATQKFSSVTRLFGSRGIRPVTSIEDCHARIRESFADYAKNVSRIRATRRGYLDQLVKRYRFFVEPGSDVLELGVGTGDLLAALDARRAVGVDISPEMLDVAKSHHPQLELYQMPAETLEDIDGPFDYVILSDLTVHLYDIMAVLAGIRRLCHERTRVIINFHSQLWRPALQLLGALGLHHEHDRTNWVTAEDMQTFLELAGFEQLKQDTSTLVPAHVGPISTIANQYLYRIPPFTAGCLVNWVVARPTPAAKSVEDLSVSVVCAARNESGHIASIVDRTPKIGKRTELIFVEGNSSDDTYERIEEELAHPRRDDLHLSLYKQPGKGKGDAVRFGFGRASGDIVMILDADMTVAPEDLPKFVEVIASGKGEFINGCRLVYPMDDQAMRFLNILGNKFFARVFSYLLNQNIKDTLCGTKVMLRSDYERIARGRSYFGDFDPFGDFDLLFGAAKLGLKIVEVPIRYRERVYGETNINRFRDGALLVRMSAFALRRLRFV